MSWAQAELERRLSNMVRIGIISEADHEKRRINVTFGDIKTAWLPWPADMGANYRRWRPLRAGQQVILLCPNGDTAQAVIVGMLYSNQLPAPSTEPAVDLIEFEDGTALQYNSENHQLDIRVVGDTTINITESGKLTVNVAGEAAINAEKIKLNNGKGVVTGGHICQYTGQPHSDCSKTVSAEV